METLFCPWDTTYFFIAETVPQLLYYSHIPAVIMALTVGVFVFFSSKKSGTSKILLVLFILFSVWTVINLFLWSNNRTDLSMTWWSYQISIELLIYATAIVLTYQYLFKKFIGYTRLAVILAFLLPAFILMPTNLYLLSINGDYCVPDENIFIVYYSYIFEIISIIYIVGILIFGLLKKNLERKPSEASLFTAGIILFLIAFTSGNIIGSATDNWELAQFGLFGMPIFITLLAYLIVHFKTFNIKLAATQALMAGLVILIGSQLLFVESTTNYILVSLTLILSILGGHLLVRSVQREIKQREQIEQLATDLERTNERLKVLDKQKSEFVSIASHQLRSPLTAIRGYVSMVQEGSYGDLSDKLKEVMKRIDDSSRFMSTSIDDFLNVSRIESGNMKYEYSNINLVDMTRQTVEDLQTDATNRALQLTFKTNLQRPDNTVYADHGKTMQILHNLINNALKYTKQGSVNVCVSDNPEQKIISVEISDTGIGMSKETLEKLFGKFTRAKIASSTNIMGTGLGLFVAREMARAMKGDVKAFSEGEDKGSKFTFTMPYEPDNQIYTSDGESN